MNNWGECELGELRLVEEVRIARLLASWTLNSVTSTCDMREPGGQHVL